MPARCAGALIRCPTLPLCRPVPLLAADISLNSAGACILGAQGETLYSGAFGIKLHNAVPMSARHNRARRIAEWYSCLCRQYAVQSLVYGQTAFSKMNQAHKFELLGTTWLVLQTLYEEEELLLEAEAVNEAHLRKEVFGAGWARKDKKQIATRLRDEYQIEFATDDEMDAWLQGRYVLYGGPACGD